MNNMFFSAGEIYARLISSYPLKSTELNKIQVQRWCSELITEVMRDPISKISNKAILCGFGTSSSVIDNKVPLPENIFKLEAVYNENMKLIKDYSYQGNYIYFPDDNCPLQVYIDYLSLPIDNNGFPLLYRGYERAAEAYCEYKLFQEDATRIPPRIQQWRWRELQENKDWEIEAAMRSWDELTENDIINIHSILLNSEWVNTNKTITVPATENVTTESEIRYILVNPNSVVTGIKTNSDAGTLGDISITDDHIYVCVKTGTAGNAVWKRTTITKL